MQSQWGVLAPTPDLPWPYGPFCRHHVLQVCRIRPYIAKRYRGSQVWRSPLDLLLPRFHGEVASWDEQSCWACHIDELRRRMDPPQTLNRLFAPDPILVWAPARQQGRGRPVRSVSQALEFRRRLEDWLDTQQGRAKLNDFAAQEGVHPSTARRWLQAGQRYGFSVHRKWSQVTAFRTA